MQRYVCIVCTILFTLWLVELRNMPQQKVRSVDRNAVAALKLYTVVHMLS